MDKIDRLGWADGYEFSSFGVRIGIRVNQPGFTASLKVLLPPEHRPSTSGVVQRLYSLIVGGPKGQRGVQRFNILYDGAARVARGRELAPVLKILETSIRRTVAEMAPRHVFVHAGVIEHCGRAVVLPGPSLSGKSTLVSELLKRGATYYSDEFAILGEKGLVCPFAKALSLRESGSFDGIDHEPEEFGATSGVKSVQIGLLAITRYLAHAKWHPRRLSVGQGALALLSHSVAARRQPRRVMKTLHRALTEALIVKSNRGEASEAARWILEALENASGETSDERELHDRKKGVYGGKHQVSCGISKSAKRRIAGRGSCRRTVNLRCAQRPRALPE